MSAKGPKPPPLDYETYAAERKELYKYQQAAYDSFEKTLTALVGSTLALSVTFLGFLQSARGIKPVPLLLKGTEPWLFGSWVCLGLALIALLLCFFANARAFTIEIDTLALALDDGSALDRSNPWRNVSLFLYAISTVLFILGLYALLYFCRENSHHVFS